MSSDPNQNNAPATPAPGGRRAGRPAASREVGLWQLTAGWRGLYSAAIAVMAIGIALMFVVPLVTGSVIDGFQAQGGRTTFVAPGWIVAALARFGLASTTWSALAFAAGLTILVTVLAGAFQYLRGRWAATASEAIMRRLRDRLHRHLSSLPTSFFDGADTGDLVQRCTSDVETVRVFLAAQVVEIGRSILLLVFVTPVLFSLDVDLALVTLALMPVVVCYSLVFFRRITRVFLEVDEAEGRLTTVLQENLTGIRVVRSFGRREFEEAKFAKANDEHRDLTWDLMRVLSLFWSASDLICFSQGALVLFAGAWWTLQGQLTLGTLVAFTMLSSMVIWPVRMMGRTLIEAGKARVALTRLREILGEAEEDHLDFGRADEQTALEQLPRQLAGTLEVEDLSFRFPRPHVLGKGTSGAAGRAAAAVADGADVTPESGPTKQILDGIDFRLEAGQTLALLGPPGAGKSALIQLLLRLYDYDGEGCSGSIRVDGIELNRLPREYLREQIGVVMQNPFLYAKTIDTNLRVGRGEAEWDEIIAATRAASIHESIESFEKGYETLLGERGVTLSGGQKQRVAIARALLKDPPILILDDALSAVDMGTERQILGALQARRGRHTTILIAHRLSAVTRADLILVLDEGRVVERGSHAELVAAGGAYARLWAIQNAYREELAQHAEPVGAAPASSGTTEEIGTQP